MRGRSHRTEGGFADGLKNVSIHDRVRECELLFFTWEVAMLLLTGSYNAGNI